LPSSSDTGNFKAYFSGHYPNYRINVQDYKCRFVNAALAAPAKANDIAALRKTKFSKLVRK